MENIKPLNILASEFSELYNWIKSISRYSKIEDFIITDFKEDRLSVKFFTKNYQYRISAKLPAPNEDKSENNNYGYLGCVVQTRKPRAGEDWNRGNDLADGKYCKETWQKIVNDIVAYELVKIVKSKDSGAYIFESGYLLPANDSNIKQNYKNK